MSDELRSPLVAAFERLGADLALGDRFGDPHLAFTILVYPDETPTIIALTERGICEFERLVAGTPDEAAAKHAKEGRFFAEAELDEAATALSAAVMAFKTFRYRKDGMKFGAHVTERVAEAVERHRSYPIERALAAAAYEEAMKWKCEGCSNRYGTERGLHMHQSRTIRTECKTALAARIDSPA